MLDGALVDVAGFVLGAGFDDPVVVCAGFVLGAGFDDPVVVCAGFVLVFDEGAGENDIDPVAFGLADVAFGADVVLVWV